MPRAEKTPGSPLAQGAAQTGRRPAAHVEAAVGQGRGRLAQPRAMGRAAPFGRPPAPHVLAAIAPRQPAAAAQAKGSGGSPARLAAHVHGALTASGWPSPPIQRQTRRAGAPAPGHLQAVLQRSALSGRKEDEIVGKLRGQAYPIGKSSIARLAGGTGSYDVGAKVYDSGGTVIGAGEYSSGEMLHAEMVALDQALGAHALTDVAKIRVTKGCCRRCAAVLTILGLADKVGPKETSPTYSGAYVIPSNVRAALATKLTLYSIEELAAAIENSTWW